MVSYLFFFSYLSMLSMSLGRYKEVPVSSIRVVSSGRMVVQPSPLEEKHSHCISDAWTTRSPSCLHLSTTGGVLVLL